VYHLSAEFYRKLVESDGYVRAHGIDRIREEGLIMEFLAAHEKVTRNDVESLLGIFKSQARRRLVMMIAAGKVKAEGRPPRGTYYVQAN
jgi:predicted HTH transcriptional regulator